MTRFILSLVIAMMMASVSVAQDSVRLPDDATLADEEGTADHRAATGGAQTLEDIMRRQRGEEVENDFRRYDGDSPMPDAAGPLGTLGGSSDPDLWRALRFGTADVTSQVQSPGARILVQDSGMPWLTFREGPLRQYGGYFLLVTIAALALFFLLRGRIRIDGGRSGVKVLRFNWFERFSHWVLATSFILLAITGLLVIFGRNGLMDWIGKDSYAAIALWSKWVHNNVSWAFMLALVSVFFLWVWHNLPSRTDLVWLAKGGGIFTSSHPPAKKFNAGQKLIFWSVVVLGGSLSVSGLALLFPFELNMFAPTFAKLNAVGAGEWIGYGPLPETLQPHAEMQLSATWHAIVGFVLMGIIIAHIYIGTIGMEGAAEAMTTGEVDLNWAREHHSIWAEKVIERGEVEHAQTPTRAHPAE